MGSVPLRPSTVLNHPRNGRTILNISPPENPLNRGKAYFDGRENPHPTTEYTDGGEEEDGPRNTRSTRNIEKRKEKRERSKERRENKDRKGIGRRRHERIIWWKREYNTTGIHGYNHSIHDYQEHKHEHRSGV
jgi:hypothetical protein